ncbi:hypothetical protein IFM89_014995 [Coptis chinensis]|uniref:Uncharacterized protein n=1 Tax=Coptis chinensis TaxID=261450 RepID=A0A835HHY2_9MAGN|nr:hypothetical protein IFM89_014995 [Coptis chinensis]
MPLPQLSSLSFSSGGLVPVHGTEGDGDFVISSHSSLDRSSSVADSLLSGRSVRTTEGLAERIYRSGFLSKPTRYISCHVVGDACCHWHLSSLLSVSYAKD